MHTRWIETEFDNTIPPYDGAVGAAEEPAERERVTVEVGGKRLEVVAAGRLGRRRSGPDRRPAAAQARAAARPGRSRRRAATAWSARCRAPSSRSWPPTGDTVAAGDTIVVLEAMKMEQPLTAHKAGTVTGLAATAGPDRHRRRDHLRHQGHLTAA